MNIFLIGYRGTGKSTVGRQLAERLGWQFLDADPYLEAKAGATIKEIFAAQGETAFRDLETIVVSELAAGDQRVLALGGGAVMREENRQALIGRGTVVWLRALPESILFRISADPTTAQRRPDLTAYGGYDEIKELLARREPIYRQCAEFSVDTEEKSVDQIVSEILSLMGR